MTRRERPWRATASYRAAPWLPPVIIARCYRATEDGLTRFVDEYRAAGCTVKVWKVLDLPEVTAAAQASAQPRPLP
jgi:hypothetical protein